jgi:hypothetical protein
MKNCCICNKQLYGYGNNPQPVMEQGECCDECNILEVLPARLSLINEKNKDEMTKICKRCNKETGPAKHSGCDQSKEKDCAWHVVDKFNKNYMDELNNQTKEQIKTNQDGKDTFGV